MIRWLFVAIGLVIAGFAVAAFGVWVLVCLGTLGLSALGAL